VSELVERRHQGLQRRCVPMAIGILFLGLIVLASVIGLRGSVLIVPPAPARVTATAPAPARETELDALEAHLIATEARLRETRAIVEKHDKGK
jgi:hypothetical protein